MPKKIKQFTFVFVTSFCPGIFLRTATDTGTVITVMAIKYTPWGFY